MAEHHFVTLGAFKFKSTSVTVGPPARTIVAVSNALADGPVQVNDFISGYRKIQISGFIIGEDTQSESANEHVIRQKTNLETEVAKDINVLVIDWLAGPTETWTVYKNEEGVSFTYVTRAQKSHYVEFSVTLNCLP